MYAKGQQSVRLSVLLPQCKDDSPLVVKKNPSKVATPLKPRLLAIADSNAVR